MKKINSKPIEIEDIFLDGLVRRGRDFELQETKIAPPLPRKKFVLFLSFGLSLLFFLLFFSFKLQILDYSIYNSLALENKFLELKIKAERGLIYSRDMEQLVSNEVRFDLLVQISDLPRDIAQQEEVLNKAALILGESLEALKLKIEKSSQDSVAIAENLSRENLIILLSKINELPGFRIEKYIQRKYSAEKSLSPVLGYIGKVSSLDSGQFKGGYTPFDYAGREGLERWYDEVLAENKGLVEIERDVAGREIARTIKDEPCSGQSIILSLDLALQKKVAQTLENIIESKEGTAAAAVAIDPDTGEVLALVSLPSFDNNLFARGITAEELKSLNDDPRHPQLNRVIGGVYPVGSTIKPLIGIAALEEGIINENTSFFCPLELCLENQSTRELECFSDWAFHGETSIKKAIAESVNPFFYIVGGGYRRPKFHPVDEAVPDYFEGLGVAKLNKWLKEFGWGERTGIDLPGEVQGRVPDADWKKSYFSEAPPAQQIWYRGDTYNLSIGQGYILITPLEVVTAFAAIANGGKIIKPRLVKEILPSECHSLPRNLKYPLGQKFSPEVVKENFVEPRSLEIVKEGMRQAVTSSAGSAAMLGSLPVEAAAKTGTAQIGTKDVYDNWVTVFAPYENPEIVLTIVIENVVGARIVAQKAAYEILRQYFFPSS